jgi:hypothetical protein
MRAKRKSRLGLIFLSIAVLAMILVVALSATAMASEKHYTFDSSKFNMKDFDQRIDWSNVGWCNFDFSKVDWKTFDWSKFDWKNFHWGHGCTTTTTECTTETTVSESTTEVTESTTTTSEGTTDTTVNDLTTDTTVNDLTTDTTESEATTAITVKDIETGGGGTSGPGLGTWAMGFFALALAGGLGYAAIRPATKRK